MSRRQWEESIALMVTKHGMHALDDKDRRSFSIIWKRRSRRARLPAAGRNPFLKP
jgi:hypothetical protein